jgi:hypothetical protein
MNKSRTQERSPFEILKFLRSSAADNSRRAAQRSAAFNAAFVQVKTKTVASDSLIA